MSEEYVPYDGEDYTPNTGSRGALPENTRVLVSVVPTKKDGYEIERRAYANQGENAGITALAVQLRIADGQVKQNARLFTNIPIARKFASGKTAHAFGGFFSALGFDVNAKEGFRVPSDDQLLGKWLTVTVGLELNNKGEIVNTVKFYDKADGGTPLGTLTQPLINGLGDLPPTHPLRVKAQQQAQQQAGPGAQAQQAWTPPPAGGAPAAPAAPAQSAPPAAWTPPPVESDPALVAAAASTPGY